VGGGGEDSPSESSVIVVLDRSAFASSEGPEGSLGCKSMTNCRSVRFICMQDEKEWGVEAGGWAKGREHSPSESSKNVNKGRLRARKDRRGRWAVSRSLAGMASQYTHRQRIRHRPRPPRAHRRPLHNPHPLLPHTKAATPTTPHPENYLTGQPHSHPRYSPRTHRQRPRPHRARTAAPAQCSPLSPALVALPVVYPNWHPFTPPLFTARAPSVPPPLHSSPPRAPPSPAQYPLPCPAIGTPDPVVRLNLRLHTPGIHTTCTHRQCLRQCHRPPRAHRRSLHGTRPFPCPGIEAATSRT
jgi:hypothetical protein